MANRPSHGLQQRIIAFVASKPNREIIRNGSHETCTFWIGKRLDSSERAVVAELETLEREGLVKLARNVHGIKSIQVVHGVEPEEWAMKEISAHPEESEPQALALPADLDYRQLGESVLLAALEVLSSGSSFQVQQKRYEDEIANLTDANSQLRAELSHVKVERDTNVRAKKVAEEAAREQKNRADEALTQVAELEADIVALQQSVRDANIGTDFIEGLNPEERAKAGEALLEILRNTR
jgi:hypothetical protein